MAISFATQDKMTLEQLQAADVPVCKTEDLLKVSREGPEGEAEADALIIDLDAYFSKFCKPTGNCISCGRTLGGVMGLIAGGFQYGIAWGEGKCGCGYPGRALHTPKDSKGEEMFDGPLQFILQYHPLGLSQTKTVREE